MAQDPNGIKYAYPYRWKWLGNSIKMVSLNSMEYYYGDPSYVWYDAVPNMIAQNLTEPIKYIGGNGLGQTYRIKFGIEQLTNTNTYHTNYGELIDNGANELSVYLMDNGDAPWYGGSNHSLKHPVITINDSTITSSNQSQWGQFEIIVTMDDFLYPQSPQLLYRLWRNMIVFESSVGVGDPNEEGADDVNWRGTIRNVTVERIESGLDSNGEEIGARCEIRINSMVGIPPSVDPGDATLRYKVDLFDQQEKLFEFKFPRFSYRYKYIDGEYSSFAPFSEVAFTPGGFDYHPKKGYNLGMTNTLKAITLNGFASSAPDDVVAVDILYKEEDSPNIYIVDTVKDFEKNEYKITSETLKNGLTHSNQLLRHWDNVPRSAKAQEVVGSRIVYGNYLQNFDLIDSVSLNDYSIELAPEILSKKLTPGAEGVSSIKSLREYQVGIVYADRYGRQTPILTNENSTFNISKNRAESSNELRIAITNEGHPVNMEYFKFYIKDNSSEYYNLAMDRYYDAEDDNIWIAFPSSDRNKVGVDDFLILKKGSDDNGLIKEAARYKIIDIKNEAPENIKRTQFLVGTKRHSNTTAAHELFDSSDLPFSGSETFSVNYDRIKSSSFSNLHNDFNTRPTDKYYITLSNDATKKVSERYEVTSLDIGNEDAFWHIHLKYPLGQEINDFTDDSTGEYSRIILDDTYLNVYKSSIDDGSKFDGRFFVKIFNDDVFRRNLVDNVDTSRKIEYKSIPDASRKIYGLATEGNTNRIDKHFDASTNYPIVFDQMWLDQSYPAVGMSHHVANSNHYWMRSWASYIEATNKVGTYLGTLNEWGSFGITAKDDQAFVGSIWMQYDAYFRGFNVDPDGINERVEKMDIHGENSSDQAFEDVWFFDKGLTAGSFENSNNSPSSGWDSQPNPKSGSGIGIDNQYETIGASIELGFGGIQPNEWPDDAENDFGGIVTTWQDEQYDNANRGYSHHRDASFYDISGTNLHYAKTQAAFIKNIAVGSQFRFKEDPSGEIYTMLDVETKFKIRYEDITTGLVQPVESWTESDSNHVGIGSQTSDSEIGFRCFENLSYPLQVLAKNGRTVKTTGLGIGGVNNDGEHGLDPAHTSWAVNATTHYQTNSSGHEIHGKYRTSSFLRASNFTKNFRIRLDKQLSWNPYQSSEAPIENGQTITLTPVNQAHGVNWIEFALATGATTAGPMQTDQHIPSSYRLADPQGNDNIFEEVRRIEIGMVIETAPNGDAITANDANGNVMLPMVSEIVTDETNTLTRVYFKNYNGGNSLTGGSVSGDLTTSGNSDITFYQYPINGLSPNSAKNLNYFRDSTGNDEGVADGTKIGTDALGYTIEFVEERSVRPPENVLSPNPAIWETEPKRRETDLDIYHAISDFNPIKVTNISNFIPIGSVITHETSNSISPDSAITSINMDGTITVSKPIRILPPEVEDDRNVWGTKTI